MRASYALLRKWCQRRLGLDPNHRSFRLKEPHFSVTAECVARLPFGVPNRNARLGRARLVWLEPNLTNLRCCFGRPSRWRKCWKGTR